MPADHPPFSALSMKDIAALRQAILDWYDAHRRDLPWRARTRRRGGGNGDSAQSGRNRDAPNNADLRAAS